MANPYVLGAAAFPYEDMALHGQTYSGMEDGLTDMPMTYIDPHLQSPSPISFGSPWEPPLRPFSKSTQAALFSADFAMQMAGRTQARPTVGIPQVPSPSHRFASPISSSEPSSSSASARSPPADTESYYDNFPRTPPDTALSPFQRPMPLEPFLSAHPIQFMGMGSGMSSDFVNPLDVSPNQQPDYCESESGNIDFSFAPTRYSYDSQPISHSDAEAAQIIAAPEFSTKRMASPEEIRPAVEDKIEVSSRYPPPPEEEENAESEEDVATLMLQGQNDDDEDDDYRPNKKLKQNARIGARRVVRARQQPAAPAADIAASLRSPVSAGRKRTRAGQLPPRSVPASSGGSRAPLVCRDCPKNDFQDQAELDSHIKKLHTRPFNCVFDFAGCESTFASKNEWKRHVTTQHLLLNYWVCTEGVCGKTSSESTSSSPNTTSSRCNAGPAPPSPGHPTQANGAIFNRKDLFTQHLKRMHAPQAIKHIVNGPPSPSSSAKKQPSSQQQQQQQQQSQRKQAADHHHHHHPPEIARLLAEWDKRLQQLHARSVRPRCRLPAYMTCPVPGCDATPFRGGDAWNQRMEHVAKHMERAALGREPRVVFGGDADPTLVAWAARDDVAIIVPAATTTGAGSGGGGGGFGAWELKSPLRRGPGGNVVVLAPGCSPSSAPSSSFVPGLDGEVVAGSGVAVAGVEEVVEGEIVVADVDVDGEGEVDADGEEDD